MPENKFFWSYPIMYLLKGDVLKSDADLKRALKTYDAGLYGDQFPADKIKITLIRPKLKAKPGTIRVTFDGFDPFTTKKPLRTYMTIYRRFDEKTKQTILLILRSSRRYTQGDPVWNSLLTFPKDVGF